MGKIIIANWKMNPETERGAESLARASDFKNVVVVPPFLFLPILRKILRRAKLGAQNTSWWDAGPYTGEVSPRELKSVGVSYVLIGHSERRAFGESDYEVNRKIKSALKDGLKAILCVGESWLIRKNGFAAAKRFVGNQLRIGLRGIRNYESRIKNNLIIAYEPVWAIGTGRNDRPEDATEMFGFIKALLDSRFKIHDSRVLYGGSVNAKNAAGFLGETAIDGALVGSASLKPAEFGKIVKIAGKY